MAVILEEAERTSLERAMNMRPDRPAGKATAEGPVRCESAWEAAGMLSSPGAAPGDVVVYRDVAFLCEKRHGRDWSAFKQGTDGSWAVDETVGIGPCASFRIDPEDDDGAMFALASMCLATKLEARLRAFGVANPFDARSRMALALPLAPPLSEEEERAAFDLAASVDGEAAEEMAREADGLLEDGATPEEVAAMSFLDARERLSPKVEGALLSAGAEPTAKSASSVLESAARAVALARPAEVAEKAARRAFPAAAVAGALDGRAPYRRGVQRRGAAASCDEAFLRRRAPSAHPDVDGETLGEGFKPGTDPFDPGVYANEPPLEPGMPASDAFVMELAADATSWTRSVDGTGVEVVQSKEAELSENGVLLYQTYERTEEGWAFSGLLEAGKSSRSPSAEDLALASASAAALSQASERMDRYAEVAAMQDEISETLREEPDLFAPGRQEPSAPSLGEVVPDSLVEALKEDEAGWRHFVEEDGTEALVSREAYAAENGVLLYQAYERTEEGWAYSGLSGRGLEPRPVAPDGVSAEEREERPDPAFEVVAVAGATAVAAEAGCLDSMLGEGAEIAASPSPTVLDKAAKETVSSIHGRQRASGVEGAAPPKRGSKAASTPAQERALARSDLRSLDKGLPGRSLSRPSR